MNETLVDLAYSINEIPEKYYKVESARVNENQDLDVDANGLKPYERRFVAKLMSRFDRMIEHGQVLSDYDGKYTDFELPKSFPYYPEINDAYNAINELEGDRLAFETIPDFFIHKSQDDMSEESQMLAVEVKTACSVNRKKLFMDFLKLCVYVKFFNYQVAVSLIVNNPIDKVIAKARKYFEIVNYFPEECVDRVWLFVKPSYNDGLTMIKLSDLRER